LSIQQEFDIILNYFKEVDIAGKVTIKSKLREVAYPDMTSMCAPPNKVKIKGSQKIQSNRFNKSTKCEPSYFEHVDVIHYMHDSSSSWKATIDREKMKMAKKSEPLPMIDQFHPRCHPYIVDVIDGLMLIVVIDLLLHYWGCVKTHGH